MVLSLAQEQNGRD